MTSTSSLGGSTRRARGLTDIVPQYDDSQSDRKSNGSGEVDQRHTTGNIKIQHLTGQSAPGRSRFPKLEECAHFHYEHVELGPLQVSLYEEEDLKSLSSTESVNENSETKWITVKVVSQRKSWLLRRSYDNFRMLDQQLHQCIYDRNFSALPELPPIENLPDKQDPNAYIRLQLRRYCERFSAIAGSLINCGPVLSWLQLDNRGRRILVTDGDNCPINTPAVAAAYAVHRYAAVASDEISFEIGDMISVIDMPPPEESIWWRGKRGFMVGFFPSHCVAVITEKVPRNLHLNQPSTAIEPTKPVLRKHGKLIAFFRAFILSRPSRRHLKQSGILKERVFGCDLGEHLLNSEREIPRVLKCCSEFIELHGIVDGIYRLSGVTSNIQKLRNTFDEDGIPSLMNDDSILQDIHSVASLLKMYFRELPNPLCTYQLYKGFVSAVQHPEPCERVSLMKDVVQKLPPPHYRTLEYLMRHLAKVAEHGSRTGMTARNIAIVWAPNLLRCKELEFGGVAALQGVGVQAVVTEFLILNVDSVFSKDHQAVSENRVGSKKIRPKSLSLGTPPKLLSLEKAQSKKIGAELVQDNNYIEVDRYSTIGIVPDNVPCYPYSREHEQQDLSGGPSCLPEKFHTVIDLPRKRVPLKRSPIGWKSFFTRGGSATGLRKSSSTHSGKRKTSVSEERSFKKDIVIIGHNESDVKTSLRPVKSAESLTSGGAVGVGNSSSARNSNCVEFVSPPSPKLSAVPGHSRSVSHDSYFDQLSESMPMHSTAIQDDEVNLSVNSDFDASEMKIFSEESSQLFSNTSSSEQLQLQHKKTAILASAENTIIADPSPKKHKTSNNSSCSSVTLSDDMTAVSNKRSRLEERLSDADFAYIDSQFPDRLTVEVDVHHRNSSIMSSPTNTLCSEGMSTCTSDATPNIAYTPLSECSFTTSSTFEQSYQRLSSSNSSSCPRRSTESVHGEGDRRSYQGEVRTSGAANRLSLQCFTDDRGGMNVFAYSYDSKFRSNNDSASYEIISKDARKLGNIVEHDGKSIISEFTSQNGMADSYMSGNDCRNEAANATQNGIESNAHNIDSQSVSTTHSDVECPYELVSIVGSRMTPVIGNDSKSFDEFKPMVTDSNYEEFDDVNAAGLDGGYEDMSPVYLDNDMYDFQNIPAVKLSIISPPKSNYEEITVLDDRGAMKRYPSNESIASSADDAMIENNLYESLVTEEDSSPDSCVKSFPNTEKPTVDSINLKVPDAYENCPSPHSVTNERVPLLCDHRCSDDSTNEPSINERENESSEMSESFTSEEAARTPEEEPQRIRPSTLRIPNDRAPRMVAKQASESNINMTGNAKRVQSLVSQFEWSERGSASGGRKDYHSLPPSLARKSSTISEEEMVRRDRIEKYKEERRSAMRKKYRCEADADDAAAEELIRRCKQKIHKNDNGKTTYETDSSPLDNVSRKSPSAAVTTISILYTTRRSAEKQSDNQSDRKSVVEREEAKDQQPTRNASVPDISPPVWKPHDRNTTKYEWLNRGREGRSLTTTSLERKKNDTKCDSLVAKRVNQLSEACETHDRRPRVNEKGSMRQRAHSASSHVGPYCIRDIAAIFESKDNK